ncbi:9349_t:CDS:2 [Acaulospora morrowiae]|uniref:9349_t:CDS:1 n=1 Tax=Acaulospora morrowiae TaxID=94023 RepID=A0A9N8ZEK3_9GLOM|nr:9349_t:CDS:2 [Acaulospora morrowiae]
MGRLSKKQQKILSPNETPAPSSTYEKYKELKRKYKELSKACNILYVTLTIEFYVKLTKCRSERDCILEQMVDSFSEPEPKRLKFNAPDNFIIDNSYNSFSNSSKHDSLTRKVKVVNDVQQKSKKTTKSIRRRQSRSIVRNMKAHHVDKDENGNHILPVEVGLHTVLNLGTIVYDRVSFHNDRYIYPVGYSVRRPYLSMIDPFKNTIYTSKIEDGREGPKFIVQADDAPGQPIIASSATGAWTPVIKQANSIRNRKHSNAASGPDYFGLSQPTIRKMIQELPNSEKCKNYIFQEFELHHPSNNGRGKPNRKKSSKKYWDGLLKGNEDLTRVSVSSWRRQIG